MASSAGPRCSAHSSALAGWHCRDCDRKLCLNCAARRRMGQGAVVVCRSCGGLARTLTVKRGRGTFPSLVWDAFAYPFSRRGILIMVGAGIVFALLKFLGGGWGARLAFGAQWSLLFLIIRTSALGQHDVPEADDVAHPSELLGAALRGFVAMAVSVLPLAIYLYFKLSSVTSVLDVLTGAHSTVPIWRDPFAYLSVAVGIAWGPLAVMLAAIHTPWSVTLNPLVLVSIVRRLGGDYLVAIGLFWAAYAASWFVDGVSRGFVAAVPIPILPRFVAETMMLYLPLVYARVLGLLLYTRGADIGYGQSDDYEEPVLGALEPAEEVVHEAVAVAPAAPMALDLDAPAPRPAPRMAAIEPPKPASPPPARPAAPPVMTPQAPTPQPVPVARIAPVTAPRPAEDLMGEADFLRGIEEEHARRAAAVPTVPPAPDANPLDFLPPADASTLPDLPPPPPIPAPAPATAPDWGDLEFIDESAQATIAVTDQATLAAIQRKTGK